MQLKIMKIMLKSGKWKDLERGEYTNINSIWAKKNIFQPSTNLSSIFKYSTYRHTNTLFICFCIIQIE